MNFFLPFPVVCFQNLMRIDLCQDSDLSTQNSLSTSCLVGNSRVYTYLWWFQKIIYILFVSKIVFVFFIFVHIICRSSNFGRITVIMEVLILFVWKILFVFYICPYYLSEFKFRMHHCDNGISHLYRFCYYHWLFYLRKCSILFFFDYILCFIAIPGLIIKSITSMPQPWSIWSSWIF